MRHSRGFRDGLSCREGLAHLRTDVGRIASDLQEGCCAPLSWNLGSRKRDVGFICGAAPWWWGLQSALWYVVHRRQMAGVRIKYTLRGAGFGQSRAEWSVLGADDDAFPSGPVSFVMPILEGGERPGVGGAQCAGSVCNNQAQSWFPSGLTTAHLVTSALCVSFMEQGYYQGYNLRRSLGRFKDYTHSGQHLVSGLPSEDCSNYCCDDDGHPFRMPLENWIHKAEVSQMPRSTLHAIPTLWLIFWISMAQKEPIRTSTPSHPTQRPRHCAQTCCYCAHPGGDAFDHLPQYVCTI